MRLLATGYGMRHDVFATPSPNRRGLRTPAPGRWSWPPELAWSWPGNAGAGARGCRTVLLARVAEELDRQSQEATGKGTDNEGLHDQGKSDQTRADAKKTGEKRQEIF